MVVLSLTLIAVVLVACGSGWGSSRDAEPLFQPRTCQPEEVDDPTVECFSLELLEKAGDDPTVRLRYPASRFQGAGAEKIIEIHAPSGGGQTPALSAADLWCYLSADSVGNSPARAKAYCVVSAAVRLAQLTGAP